MSEPPPRPLHRRQLVRRAQKGARQVGLQRGPPILQGKFAKRSKFAEHGGVVEGDVQPAEARFGRFDQALRKGLVADVAGDCDGFAALGLDRLHQRVEFGPAPAGGNHLGSFGGKELCGGETDAGAGAGDDRHLAR